MTSGNGTAVDAGVRRKVELCEILVFLFLIAPSMILSFLVVRQGLLSFTLTAYATILRDLSLVSLIAFFLWRNGEALSKIGWIRKSVWSDVLLGVTLFVLMFLGAGLLQQVLKAVGLSEPAAPLPRFLSARSGEQYVLAFVLVVVVAIAEEAIFRGYLILRLSSTTGSTTSAVILSSVIFALGHGYEGSAGVITVAYMGLFFAVVYVRRRSLVAPMVMHFLQDFIGIVLLPLLGLR
jgi:membrane protease YdiL (CAAX protease family)